MSHSIVSDHCNAILSIHVYCIMSSMHSIISRVSLPYVRIVTVPFVVLVSETRTHCSIHFIASRQIKSVNNMVRVYE